MKNIAKYIKYIVLGILLSICVIYLFSRCGIFDNSKSKKEGEKAQQTTVEKIKGEDVEKIVKNMTLEEKVYQMFFVTPEQLTGVGEVIQAGDTTKKAVENKPVGGVVYFAQNLQTTEQTTEMITKTQGYSKISMFMAVDEEGGAVSRIGDNPALGMEKIESMGSIGAGGDYKKAKKAGDTIGKKMSELGFNVDFAPVADVLDGDNIIGNRSFGEDANVVSDMVSEFIYGLSENNISATLKHFPGQGATTGDTHKNYIELNKSEGDIRKTELVPFISGIESGADFVMIGHMTVKAFDSKNPATFSKRIVTDLLRKELGFEGIIITDAMNMGAIVNEYKSGEAAVKAVEAGVDMILMPQDFDVAYKAVLKAVKDGDIPESRIDESVTRILKIKAKRNLI